MAQLYQATTEITELMMHYPRNRSTRLCVWWIDIAIVTEAGT